MFEMVVSIVVGVVLVTAGLVMLVVPGPGLLVIAMGVGLILSQSGWGRSILARVRLWSRQRFGSHRARAFERRVPDRVFPPADTEELRLESLRRRLRPGDDATSAGPR